MKMLWSILFLVSISSASFADVRSFERSVEDRVQNLAQVQFGSRDAVAVVVKASSSKKKTTPERVAPDSSQDVGYLPLPYWNMSGPEEDFDTIIISIMAANNLDTKALDVFKTNVKKMFTGYKVTVRLQSVDFSEPKKRDIASEKPAPVEPPKDVVSIKDYLQFGALFLGISILGILLLFGMKFVANAIRSAAESFSGLVSLKQNGGAKAPVEEKEEKRPLEESVDLPPDLVGGSLEESLSHLRRVCASQPYKAILALSFSAADQIGMRWLLSQLDETSRLLIKDFMGSERVITLSQDVEPPKGFSLKLWAQNYVEKITLLTLEGPSFLEKTLKNEDLIFLFRSEAGKLFESALHLSDPSVWRLALEVLPQATFDEMKGRLSTQDWLKVLQARHVEADDISAAFNQLKASLGELSAETRAVKSTVGQKIMDPLLGTVKNLAVGEDEEFIQRLRQEQPDVAEILSTRIWTFADLRMVEERALSAYIGTLSNEQLYSLLLVAPEPDRHQMKDMLPPGMKREVVLDLLKKGLEKNSSDERIQALKLARKVLDEALLKLRDKKKTAAPAGVAA